MTRAEHLQWAKDRAMEYLEKGNLMEAYQSFRSDMNKHDELKGHVGHLLGDQLLLAGKLNSTDAMKAHIDGFR